MTHQRMLFALAGFLMALALLVASCSRSEADSPNRKDPDALQSRSVELRGLKVRRVFRGGEYLLAGPGTNGVLLVRLRELSPNIKEGRTVDIAGVINPVGVDLSQWNLDPEDRKIASQHRIFINEMGIHPSSVD